MGGGTDIHESWVTARGTDGRPSALWIRTQISSPLRDRFNSFLTKVVSHDSPDILADELLLGQRMRPEGLQVN